MINLILDELITNYVTHSVGLVESPKIHVTVKFDDDGLVLVFEDSGPLFDPTVVEIGSDSPQPREADGGGVGLHLIRSYADQIQYTALGGRNRIVFRCGVDQASEGTERLASSRSRLRAGRAPRGPLRRDPVEVGIRGISWCFSRSLRPRCRLPAGGPPRTRGFRWAPGSPGVASGYGRRASPRLLLR